MIKVEHMGVSPSQAKSKKGNHVFPEESTSEKSHEIGSEYLLTDLSENKNQCGRAITQTESAEIAAGVSCSSFHKPSIDYVVKGSSPEHLGLLPKGFSEHNHTHQSFCPQETVSGKTLEHKETLEKKHQRGSEIVQNKFKESCTWVCGLPAKQSKPFSKGLSKNAITDSLGLSPEDRSKYTQTDRLSCPQQGSAGTTVGFGSGNICKELSESPEQGQEHDFESNGGKRLQSASKGANNVIQTSKSSLVDPLGLPQEFASGYPRIQQPGLHCEDMAENSSAE